METIFKKLKNKKNVFFSRKFTMRKSRWIASTSSEKGQLYSWLCEARKGYFARDGLGFKLVTRGKGAGLRKRWVIEGEVGRWLDGMKIDVFMKKRKIWEKKYRKNSDLSKNSNDVQKNSKKKNLKIKFKKKIFFRKIAFL